MMPAHCRLEFRGVGGKLASPQTSVFVKAKVRYEAVLLFLLDALLSAEQMFTVRF